MTTKKVYYDFFPQFFIKFSGSQTFFLAPFSRKISTFVLYCIIGSIVTFCGVKISAQLSKSPCIEKYTLPIKRLQEVP
jgi:hypothetical protein